ncbi:MAG: hypothetical protein ACOYJB_00670 [Christensenellaceae bacterium]
MKDDKTNLSNEQLGSVSGGNRGTHMVCPRCKAQIEIPISPEEYQGWKWVPGVSVKVPFRCSNCGMVF